MENDHLSTSFCRSKSYDDLANIFETENEEPNYDTRKSFSRQGAFRKRMNNMEILKFKRNSLMDPKKLLNATLHFSNDCEFPLEKEKNSQKKSKNGLSSFSLVKDMWKSLKRDNKVLEKEDTKKKSMDRPVTLNNANNLISEMDGSSLHLFLKCHGEKFTNITGNIGILTESSWEELLDNTMELTKLEVDRQNAIWEIIETEATYINQLSIVSHVFYPILQSLLTSYHSELANVDIQDMFANVNELCINQWSLWNNCISLPMSASKIRRVPLDIMLMKNGFCKISKMLSGYVAFMRNLPTLREKIRKAQSESSIFGQYIEWTKSYCRLCRDGHMCILSLPFQRITRYKILLERVRSLSSEDQRADITDMIESVHSFLQQMNAIIVGKYSMKDIKEKIVDNCMRREHTYDTNRFLNDDDFRFDLMRPLFGFPERILIHEGRLKLRKCYNKTLEVHCYLCSDLLMMCTSLKNNWEKMKMYKSPVRLDKLLMKEESEGSFMVIVYNDFRVVENVLVFAADGDEVKLWIEKCNRAKTAFLNRFVEPTIGSFMGNSYSNDVVPTMMDDVCLDECQRIWKCSETTSSTDSTYSSDSAFSQASSNSTQIDSSTSLTKCSPDQKYSSFEDLSTINEDYPDSYIPRQIDSTDNLI